MKLTQQWNLRKQRMEGTFYSIVIRIRQKEGSNSRQWFMSYIWLYCNCYVLKFFACCVFSLYTCCYVTSAIQHRKWNVDKLLPNRSATSRDPCSSAICIWTIVSCFVFLRNPFAAVLTDMAERPKGYGMTAELKEKVSNRTSKFARVSACGVTLRSSVVATFWSSAA